MFSEPTRRVTHSQMQRNRNRETAFREQQTQVAKMAQNVRNFKGHQKKIPTFFVSSFFHIVQNKNWWTEKIEIFLSP